MKKTGIINAPISAVVARLEHTDMLTVADAGLPVPNGVERIDLALKRGVPGFLETLEVVLSEMYVEKAYVSEDILEKSPHILARDPRAAWRGTHRDPPAHGVQALDRFDKGGDPDG